MPLDISLIFHLRKIIEEKKVQIIHTHQSVDAIHAHFSINRKEVKHVMNFHGYTPNKKNDFVRRFLIPKVDANIVTSNSFLERLRSEGKFKINENCYVLYNGVDIKKFIYPKTDFRNDYNISEKTFLLGSVGNFRCEKDQLTICKALPKIFNTIPNLKFVFVGGPINRDYKYFNLCKMYCTQNNLNEKVIFMDKVVDISPILNQINLFISSSVKESFGIAAVEAMMIGIPCILSDIPPHLEISLNGNYASIFKSKNENDLAEKVIDLVMDPRKRDNFGVEGRHWAVKNFSIENYIQRLKELYSKLIA